MNGLEIESNFEYYKYKTAGIYRIQFVGFGKLGKILNNHDAYGTESNVS
jgi:hypothetical protein